MEALRAYWLFTLTENSHTPFGLGDWEIVPLAQFSTLENNSPS